LRLFLEKPTSGSIFIDIERVSDHLLRLKTKIEGLASRAVGSGPRGWFWDPTGPKISARLIRPATNLAVLTYEKSPTFLGACHCRRFLTGAG